MDDILLEERFDYVTGQDKAFVRAFNAEMNRLGYDYGGKIGSGYCWGNHMLIYRKTGVKSENVYARIYLRNDGSSVLRLFLNDIDKHRVYLENAPARIKDPFINEFGMCKHDHNEREDGSCRFRKSYTLDGRLIEKCNGITFEFPDTTVEAIPDYIALFTEFFPQKRSKKAG